MSTVGVAELRQNLSRYLRRVEQGERLVVTDHNRPVAVLIPAPADASALDRLISSGRASAPKRKRLPNPLPLTGGADAIGRALAELRDEDR